MVGAIQSDIDRQRQSATLCQFYLNNNYRKKNISDTLLESILNNLKKQNIKNVHLFVSLSQSGAINLYKRFGFKLVKKSKLQLGDGAIHDGLFMTKYI